MTGSYMMGGENFPVDPIAAEWQLVPVGEHGTGEPVFGPVWGLSLSFGVLDAPIAARFLYDKFAESSLQSARLPHPKTGALVDFYGVNISDTLYRFSDVSSGYFPGAIQRNSYTEGARVQLQIYLGYTGSA